MNTPILTTCPLDSLSLFQHSLPSPPDTFYEHHTITYRLGKDIHRLSVQGDATSQATVQCEEQILSLTTQRETGLIAY